MLKPTTPYIDEELGRLDEAVAFTNEQAISLKLYQLMRIAIWVIRSRLVRIYKLRSYKRAIALRATYAQV